MTISGFKIFMIEVGPPAPAGKPAWCGDVETRYWIAIKDDTQIRANSLKYLKTKIKKWLEK
jgi:hypothetical protein